jgi:hypothetical protein
MLRIEGHMARRGHADQVNHQDSGHGIRSQTSCAPRCTLALAQAWYCGQWELWSTRGLYLKQASEEGKFGEKGNETYLLPGLGKLGMAGGDMSKRATWQACSSKL